jgi:F0F1-type ATP synthase assembly protein I
VAQEEPDEQPKTPEEEEAERIEQQKADLLERVAEAAKRKLPEPPNFEVKRPPAPKEMGGGGMVGQGSGLAIGVLYSLMGPTLGGMLIGWYADERCGTSPKWMATGFLIGFIAGAVMLVRLVSRMNQGDGK